MLSRELVLFLSRENYSPCATALKEKKRGKKKWVKGLDNSGNIEGPLVPSSTADLYSRQQVTCDVVLAQEDDGLAVWFLRLGPNMRTHAADPAHGGGQYLLVAGGTLRHEGSMLPRLSCLYISADAGPFVLQSGAEGLEALLLQFPIAVSSAVQPGSMSRTQGRVHWCAVTENAGSSGRSVGSGKSAM